MSIGARVGHVRLLFECGKSGLGNGRNPDVRDAGGSGNGWLSPRPERVDELERAHIRDEEPTHFQGLRRWRLPGACHEDGAVPAV